MSIWKPVNDRIVQASRDAENEIIGLLLGRLEDDTLVIEDSVTGEYSAQPERVELPSHTLAKIADDMVNGRIEGSIVGWYHSHTEGGLFFSATDIRTQKKLQQFSSLITGMVVDAVTDAVGYFRVDPQTGKPIRIPAEKVRIYEERSEAVPAQRRLRSQVTPSIEVAPRRRPLTRKVILSMVLVALIASLSLTAVLFLMMPAGPALVIIHNPVLVATIGTPVDIRANVTGTVRNVTLAYAQDGSTTFTKVSMTSASPGEYHFSIPGDQMTRAIRYYIKATDASGRQERSSTYETQIADFVVVPNSTAFTVYPNGSTNIQVSLLSINGFNRQVSLSASGKPEGVTITFDPNPSAGTVNMNVAGGPTAANGIFPVMIIATYSPPDAPPVMRQTKVTITIADFDLQVSPNVQEIRLGAAASYALNLTIHQGFMDAINITVQGLPSGTKASYQLWSTGNTTLAAGPGMRTLILQIDTTLTTKSGTYALKIVASGGGLVHYRIVQLTVR